VSKIPGDTNFWEQGSRRRQIRRVERRIKRIEAKAPISFGQGLIFRNFRLGNLRLRREQLIHDYTHRV
jgi:hypothetical protein